MSAASVLDRSAILRIVRTWSEDERLLLVQEVAMHAVNTNASKTVDELLHMLSRGTTSLADRIACCDLLGMRHDQGAVSPLLIVFDATEEHAWLRIAALRALRMLGNVDRTDSARQWRTMLADELNQQQRDIADIPAVIVYPTPGDSHGPYSDMYGREEEPNPEYVARAEDIAWYRDTLARLDAALQ